MARPNNDIESVSLPSTEEEGFDYIRNEDLMSTSSSAAETVVTMADSKGDISLEMMVRLSKHVQEEASNPMELSHSSSKLMGYTTEQEVKTSFCSKSCEGKHPESVGNQQKDEDISLQEKDCSSESKLARKDQELSAKNFMVSSGITTVSSQDEYLLQDEDSKKKPESFTESAVFANSVSSKDIREDSTPKTENYVTKLKQRKEKEVLITNKESLFLFYKTLFLVSFIMNFVLWNKILTTKASFENYKTYKNNHDTLLQKEKSAFREQNDLLMQTVLNLEENNKKLIDSFLSFKTDSCCNAFDENSFSFHSCWVDFKFSYETGQCSKTMQGYMSQCASDAYDQIFSLKEKEDGLRYRLSRKFSGKNFMVGNETVPYGTFIKKLAFYPISTTKDVLKNSFDLSMRFLRSK